MKVTSMQKIKVTNIKNKLPGEYLKNKFCLTTKSFWVDIEEQKFKHKVKWNKEKRSRIIIQTKYAKLILFYKVCVDLKCKCYLLVAAVNIYYVYYVLLMHCVLYSIVYR